LLIIVKRALGTGMTEKKKSMIQARQRDDVSLSSSCDGRIFGQRFEGILFKKLHPLINV
jgi:hypothetical protein